MRRLILPLIMLAIPALGVAWFLANYERVPVKRMTTAKGEARLKDFLAAERFAARMGMRAGEVRSLPQLQAMPPGGVLLVPARRQALDQLSLQRILGWVAGGGHLIAEAEYLGVEDPLLDALGVARDSGKVPPKTLVAVSFKDARYEVSFPDAMALKPRATPKLSAGDKLHVTAHGKGMVTVATTLHFARNHSIGKHDHAPFLWALLQATPAAELRVLFRPEQLSLWGFLGEHALPVLLAAGALLAAWLWRIAPRFGPVAPDLPPARRRLLDHLRATGRYYWASGLRSRLVVAARDTALRRIARAQPDFAAASQPERAARLSTLTGISVEEAAQFLAAAGAARGADLIRIIQHAQRVHSVLEKGNDK